MWLRCKQDRWRRMGSRVRLRLFVMLMRGESRPIPDSAVIGGRWWEAVVERWW